MKGNMKQMHITGNEIILKKNVISMNSFNFQSIIKDYTGMKAIGIIVHFGF